MQRCGDELLNVANPLVVYLPIWKNALLFQWHTPKCIINNTMVSNTWIHDTWYMIQNIFYFFFPISRNWISKGQVLSIRFFLAPCKLKTEHWHKYINKSGVYMWISCIDETFGDRYMIIIKILFKKGIWTLRVVRSLQV